MDGLLISTPKIIMHPTLKNLTSAALLYSSCLAGVLAGPEDFTTGPVIKEYGENARIPNGLANAESQHFKVVFDVYKENETDSPHRGFNTVARFINMHARAGVPIENINVAVVVHGKATYELLNEKAFHSKFNKQNPSIDLLSKLLETNVDIYVCGQSAAYHGIDSENLHTQVKVSLSAMTANALLQQQGYTLNPF